MKLMGQAWQLPPVIPATWEKQGSRAAWEKSYQDFTPSIKLGMVAPVAQATWKHKIEASYPLWPWENERPYSKSK
jgi:hypothetical protein